MENIKKENRKEKEEGYKDFEPTQLEYLITLRAINYDKKDWVYLTLKQRLAFLVMLRYLGKIEDSTTICELVYECKKIVDSNAPYWKKEFGKSVGDKFSSGVLRLVVFMAIPIFLGIQQKKFPKIIRLTPLGKKFVAWQEEDWINKDGEKIPNHIRWIRKDKIDFVEE